MASGIVKRVVKIVQKTRAKKNTTREYKLDSVYAFFAIAMDTWRASAQGAPHRTPETRQKSVENDL